MNYNEAITQANFQADRCGGEVKESKSEAGAEEITVIKNGRMVMAWLEREENCFEEIHTVQSPVAHERHFLGTEVRVQGWWWRE